MKTKLLIVLSFISLNLLASNYDKIFELGNQAYADKNYSEALSFYDSVYDMGYESVALYYNLGNVHYQLGHLGESVLFYEKAAKLDPNDEDIQHNLEILQQQKVDRFQQLPSNLFEGFRSYLLELFHPDVWAVLSLVFMVLVSGGLFLYYYTSKVRFGAIAAVTSFLLGAYCVIMAFGSDRYLQNNRGIVVMTPNAYLKIAPSETADDAFILHEGTKATLVEEFNDWAKVRLPDGKRAWIQKELVAEI